jgi:signal peptidase I
VSVVFDQANEEEFGVVPVEPARGSTVRASDDPDDDSGTSSSDRSSADGRGRGSSPSDGDGLGASKLVRTTREYSVLVVIAVVLASLVRAFLGQAYWIPSGSMIPTLREKDRVIVSRISFKLGDPKRGDIIVFQNPEFVDRGRKDPISKGARNVLELVGIGQPKNKYYIKRAIGMPGDRLSIHDNRVFINGKELAEPWLPKDVFTADNGEYGGVEMSIPKGKYFMMGDNRDFSSDSRVFGLVDRSAMVGRAFVRIYPFGRIGGL